MKTVYTILIACILTTPSLKAQDKEKFEGQSLLAACSEEIPVSYSTKDKEPFLEAVNRLDSVELVLVTAKRWGKPTYQFYYFQKTEAVDGETAYLTLPKDYFGRTPYKSALFLKYKEGKHFFFRADCFREKLEENDELRSALKRES